MRYEQVNRWLSVAANVAVIAGMLFLAIELKQNNDLLDAEVRLERARIRIDAYGQYLANDALLQAILKSRGGESLDDAGRVLVESLAMQIFTRWEYVVGEIQNGWLDLASAPIEDWQGVMRDNPYMTEAWEQRGRTAFRPEFVEFVDRYIVETRSP